jgi:hypothetical protein
MTAQGNVGTTDDRRADLFLSMLQRTTSREIGETNRRRDRLPHGCHIEEEVLMKRSILALAAVLTLAAGATTAAKAVEFGIGPGGVYVGPDRYYDYDRYSYYRGGSNCRVVIDHRINRFGEDVTVRRRICD